MTTAETVDCTDVVGATAQLIDRVSSGDDDVMSKPSLLPNWSSGHVIAHLALNAEAFVLVAESLRNGDLGVMYPDGSDGRNADIAELASEPAPTLLARLRDSAAAFEHAWSDPVPDGPCTPAIGGPEFPASSVLLRRLREVAAHGVDIGHGLLTPADWSDRYVAVDLPLQWTGVSARLPEGVGVAVTDELGHTWTAGRGDLRELDLSRRETLAWVIDRNHVDALATLASWG